MNAATGALCSVLITSCVLPIQIFHIKKHNTWKELL